MLRKVMLLPDIHYPNQDKPSLNAVLKFMKWFKPNAVVLLGDALEGSAVNAWKMQRGDKKFFEGKRLAEEYEGFINDVLDPIEKIAKRAEKIYMGGNHELWVNYLVNKLPQVEGMLEVEKYLHLDLRGWEWIPYIVLDENGSSRRGVKQFGKLLVMHGHYTNKYHAAKTADTYSKSVAYGHVHDVQLYTKVFSDDAGYHTAQSIGCLCNKAPEFMRGKSNNWTNAFGLLYVRDDGYYNLYVPIIIKGKFTYAGKTFDGNK
jgi:predicted phosphodiesterase